MFQNGISRNTKCAERNGFRRAGHICMCALYTTYVYVQYTTEVEDSYNGPKLEADITPEFMKDLLKWYKEEKKLHKKYCYKVSIMK